MSGTEREREPARKPAKTKPRTSSLERPGGGNPNASVSVTYTGSNAPYTANITVTPVTGKTVSSVRAANFTTESNGTSARSSLLSKSNGAYQLRQGVTTNTYFGIYVTTSDGTGGGDLYEWGSTSSCDGWSVSLDSNNNLIEQD